MSDLVVLRGVEIEIDSDIGQGFVVDCCRYCEGLMAEEAVRAKYHLDDSSWARLADNEPLVRAVERMKVRRVHDGSAAREKAQRLFIQAPDVLGGILNAIEPRRRASCARSHSADRKMHRPRMPGRGSSLQ